MTSALPPRCGIWALVHGSRAALQDPDEPYDASWARNKALVLEAERLGYDSVLVAQHTINPHNSDFDQLEAWTASAALAALTGRIEIIAAIKPYLYHPVVLAKMAQQIEHISGGRFAINLVNAWNRPELERAGIGFADLVFVLAIERVHDDTIMFFVIFRIKNLAVLFDMTGIKSLAHIPVCDGAVWTRSR